MKIAAGIIALLGALAGLTAAFFTLFFGEIIGLFWTNGARAFIVSGWGGIISSSLCIVFSMICIFSKSWKPGSCLLVSAMAGALSGGPQVAVCMAVCIISSFFCMPDKKEGAEVD